MSTYLAPGAVLGRYRITGTLGHGGMGVVYAGVREDLDRKVALKVLSPELANEPGFRRRFAREARTLSEVYSPHIIDIYEHGEQDGCLFIATPLVSGGDLRSLLVERGGLPPVEALALVEQVSSALADAHAAGVIHRDIKPSNVLLHDSSDGGRFAYLCDFGIATTSGDETTPMGGPSGTQGYMAPERHLGAQSTPASDIYSLGCLLFATLTGRAPYQGTDVQVAAQHLHGAVPQYPAPGVVAGAVNAILQRSMAKDPSQRYGSAAEMRDDVTRARMLAESHPAETLAAGGSTPPETSPAARPPGDDQPGPTPSRTRRRLRGRLRGRAARAAAFVVAVAVLVSTVGLIRTWSDPPPECTDSGALATAECWLVPWARSQATSKVTCWDAAEASRKTDCTTPAGLPGLLWVFPSLARDLGSCERVVDPTVDPSLRRWRCPLPDTADTTVTYTEWLSAVAAREHLDLVLGRPKMNFVVGDKAAGYRWWSTEPDGRGLLKMSVAYLHIPFSATMSSRTSAGLDRACGSIVARSPRTFLGEALVCRRPARQNAF